MPREEVPQSQLYKGNGASIVNVDNTVSFLKVYGENGVLNIEIPDYNHEETALGVSDLSGRIVWKKDIYSAKTQIDTSGFAKGVYLITVHSKSFSQTVRQIIY